MSLFSDVAAIRKTNAEVLVELRKLNETEEKVLELLKKLLTDDPVVGIDLSLAKTEPK